MDEWDINYEQRMVLRLSELAAAVVEEDKRDLKAKSPSDFVCRVFENYYETAGASIGRTLLHNGEELRDLLGENSIAVDVLLRRMEQDLILQHGHYEKSEEKLPIRLQNETCKKLKACKALEGNYYSRPSLYLKAVMEEYCRQLPIQRERIYLSDRLQCIETAIHEKRQLRLETESGRVYLVHPCKLITDKLANGWYLAGFSRKEDQGVRSKKPASFRVSAMASVELTDKQAVVSAQLHKELDKMIRQRGVQFLVEEPCRILVKMSEAGKRNYGRIKTLRPPCCASDSDIWEFYCTELQAQRYFMRMAADCEIIEPESLRQRIKEELEKAAENYTK